MRLNLPDGQGANGLHRQARAGECGNRVSQRAPAEGSGKFVAQNSRLGSSRRHLPHNTPVNDPG